MQSISAVMQGAARDMKLKICRKCRQERSVDDFRPLINGAGAMTGVVNRFHSCRYCQIFSGKTPGRRQMPYNGPYIDKWFEDGFTVYKLPSTVGLENFFGDSNYDS